MYFKQYICILYINSKNKSKRAIVNCVLYIILFICRRARARIHGWQVVRILYLRLLAPPYQLMIHWLHYTLLQIFIIYDGHSNNNISHRSISLLPCWDCSWLSLRGTRLMADSCHTPNIQSTAVFYNWVTSDCHGIIICVFIKQNNKTSD